MQVFPNITSAFVSGVNIVKPWIQYLQQFTQAPPAFTPLGSGGAGSGIVTNASSQGFPYTAAEPGFVFIDGGVTQITLTRGSITIDCTGALFIPVSIGDTVDIVGTPTVAYFIPIYGANTQS